MDYREKIRPAAGVRVLFAVIMVLGFILTVTIWVLRGHEVFPATVVTLLATGMPACLLLCHVRVTLTSEHLTVTLVPFVRKRFRVDDISGILVIEAGPREFGGYGYRLTGGRSGFVMTSGSAIEFTVKGGHRYVITTPNSADLAAALRALGAA